MGTLTVPNLISRAGTLLQDAANVRWTAAEMLNWVNDGQREVVLYRPEASVSNSAILLAAGVTKQTLPAAGVMLLDIVRNMGSGGSTPGAAIRVVAREALDSAAPSWHSTANALGYIENFTFDPRDPRDFYVYPMAPATAWYVEAVYSVTPADCTSNSVITLDDVYFNALVNYVLHRCYSKDATFAANAAAASAYYSAFVTALTGKSNSEAAGNPNIPTKVA